MIGESHTFALTFVTLANPSVNVASIVVTEGGAPRILGLDYLVTQIGDRTRIEIPFVPAGIIIGDTILVDYTFVLPPVLEYHSQLLASSARVDLDTGLALYARQLWDDRTVTEGKSDSRVEDNMTWLVGAEFARYGATLIAEYESVDNGLLSSERRYAELRYDRTIFEQWRASGNASWALTSFSDPKEDVTSLWFQAGLDGTLFRTVRAEFFAWMRTERGRVASADTEDLGVRGEFEWRMQQLRARLKVEHTFENRSARQRTRDIVSIEVRRAICCGCSGSHIRRRGHS